VSCKVLGDPLLAPFFQDFDVKRIKNQQEVVMAMVFGGADLLQVRNQPQQLLQPCICALSHMCLHGIQPRRKHAMQLRLVHVWVWVDERVSPCLFPATARVACSDKSAWDLRT